MSTLSEAAQKFIAEAYGVKPTVVELLEEENQWIFLAASPSDPFLCGRFEGEAGAFTEVSFVTGLAAVKEAVAFWSHRTTMRPTQVWKLSESREQESPEEKLERQFRAGLLTWDEYVEERAILRGE